MCSLRNEFYEIHGFHEGPYSLQNRDQQLMTNVTLIIYK
jgi:hypothetical protein